MQIRTVISAFFVFMILISACSGSGSQSSNQGYSGSSASPETSSSAVPAAPSETASSTQTVSPSSSSEQTLSVIVPPLAYDNNSITVIWQKPTVYSNISGYNIYINGTYISTTTNLFYTSGSLNAGTQYVITVKAKNSSGTELYSGTVEQKTTSATVFNVVDYGAKGDATTLDTAAIQSAISACTSGGTVLIPSGKTFLSGAIFLKSDMTLQIDGVLRGSDSASDYPKTSFRFPYYATGNNYNGLINAYYTSAYGDIKNVRICGSGTVNGASDTVGSITGHNLTKLGTSEAGASGSEDSDRADMITAKGVNGLYIGGLTLVNPAMHTMFISYSSNITINGITANTYDIHNADGVDLATSDTAYIFNSTFDTGDDCINFNAGVGASGVTENVPLNNVRVFNCTTKRGHGAVVFGSFTAAWIKNVLVEDCTFDGTDIGLRFKTGATNGGGAKNVICRDLIIKNILSNSAIFLDSTYDSSYTSAGAGQFKDISVYNVTCTTIVGYGIYINGLSGTTHTGLSFKNISVSGATKGGAKINYCSSSTFDTVNTGASVWTIANSTGITFTGCTPAQTNIP